MGVKGNEFADRMAKSKYEAYNGNSIWKRGREITKIYSKKKIQIHIEYINSHICTHCNREENSGH